MPSSVASDVEAQYRRALAAAIERRVHIVCFNELALPTRDGKPPVALFQHLRQQANKHNVLILAGSLHDWRTHMNNGYAFYPGCGEFGYVFHKQISAIAPGERITAPPQRTIAYTHVAGLTVASIICLDLADYNIVSAIVRAQVDLLFVSCYATVGTDALRKIGLAISECIPGQVFLVNHVSAGLQPSFELDRGRLRDLPTAFIDRARLATSTVSIEEVERRRQDFPDQWRSEWKWLFSEDPAPEARLEPR
jgi:predicted amidohydrolase